MGVAVWAVCTKLITVVVIAPRHRVAMCLTVTVLHAASSFSSLLDNLLFIPETVSLLLLINVKKSDFNDHFQRYSVVYILQFIVLISFLQH